MKKIRNYLALILCLSLLTVYQSSFAESLQNTDIEKFINTMQAINASDDPSIIAIKDKSVVNPLKELPIDSSGSLNIYSRVIEQVVEPAAKSSLEKITKDNGFASLSQWASVSDRVLVAFLNLKLQKEGASNIPELTPDIRASMPPEMIQMVEQASKMVDSVKNASPADVSLVKDSYSQIDQLMQ